MRWFTSTVPCHLLLMRSESPASLPCKCQRILYPAHMLESMGRDQLDSYPDFLIPLLPLSTDYDPRKMRPPLFRALMSWVLAAFHLGGPLSMPTVC